MTYDKQILDQVFKFTRSNEFKKLLDETDISFSGRSEVAHMISQAGASMFSFTSELTRYLLGHPGIIGHISRNMMSLMDIAFILGMEYQKLEIAKTAAQEEQNVQ